MIEDVQPGKHLAVFIPGDGYFGDNLLDKRNKVEGGFIPQDTADSSGYLDRHGLLLLTLSCHGLFNCVWRQNKQDWLAGFYHDQRARPVTEKAGRTRVPLE